LHQLTSAHTLLSPEILLRDASGADDTAPRRLLVVANDPNAGRQCREKLARIVETEKREF